jgi:hypothetical protein
MSVWEAVSSGLDHGGYVAWETALSETLGSRHRDFLPLFVVLQQPADQPMSLVEAIDATLALPGCAFSQHERDLLATERALAREGGWPHEVRTVVFCPRDRLGDIPAFWRVVMVGPPLAMPSSPAPATGRNLCAFAGDLDPNVPIAAVIDDGIGFLNARFRAARGHTRIRSVWLQAPERVAGSDAMGRSDVLCGRVLEQDEIDGHLAAGGDEAEVYAQVNRALLPVTDGALTNRRAAHGTHVLDLLAGAQPQSGDPVGAVPILAVQLPPAAVRDTAGRRVETYMLQGLRWILAEALRQSLGTDVPPVVVSISLGSLAGPGDQHAPVAEWFAYEIERHRRVSDGGEVRLVIAYGNARLARLVARDALRRSQPMDLIWRVQPDDHSSSFLELRAETSVTGGLRLELMPPSGSGLAPLSVAWPAPGTGWRMPGPMAAVSGHAEAGGRMLVHIALAPTAGLGPLPHCPPGDWRLTIRTTEAEPVFVSAKVQRDDTPPGYRTLGRQSWLDHPMGWDWDAEARGYVAPRPLSDAPGCPVTRAGSYVAYAGVEHPCILFAGSARPQPGQPGLLRPSHYSAEGLYQPSPTDGSHGPTVVALGDDGTMLPGRLAAGVVSGSVARMSGSSMVAPQVARALLRYFLTVPPEDRSTKAERIALTGDGDWQDPDPRMGHGALVA